MDFSTKNVISNWNLTAHLCKIKKIYNKTIIFFRIRSLTSITINRLILKK
jgi:hypothetical protein